MPSMHIPRLKSAAIIEQQKKVNEQQEESITEIRSELNDLKAKIMAIKAGK